MTKQISNELLLTEGENLTVSLPSADCILGDKLTAFAPYTTGIPLHKNKDLEVIKQFFDVSNLIDVMENFNDVRDTYFAVSAAELQYRASDATSNQTLEDTIQAAVCIGSRGKTAPLDFPSYVRGTRDIVNHIYDPGFSMETASTLAPKVIYLAACLITNQPFTSVEDAELLRSEALTQEDLKTMKAMKKLRTNSYAYLVKSDRLLGEYRK